jgi:PAS domain S-box-containing protein
LFGVICVASVLAFIAASTHSIAGSQPVNSTTRNSERFTKSPATHIAIDGEPASYGALIYAGLRQAWLVAGESSEAASPLLAAFGRYARKAWRRRRENPATFLDVYAKIAATSADIGLWYWDPRSGTVWMNDACRRLIGVEGEGVIQFELFTRLLAGRRQEKARSAISRAVLSSTAFASEFRLSGHSGRTLWLAVTGQCIRNGDQACMAGTMRDCSDLKMAQLEAQQLRQQVIHLTRVSTLGELSGALAHELNQPLTAILTNAQAGHRLIGREALDPAEIREILSDIIDDDRRAGAVLGRLRALVRNEQVDFSAMDLNQVVEEVLTLMRSDLIERRIEFTCDLADDIPAVRGDRVQIQQVLINLMRNACDAMNAVRTRQHRIALTTARSDEGSVTVTVTDNGSGLPADLQNRIFDPFITTKPQGMGLGLAICRSIMSMHGGDIWCANRSEGGALFGFSLPVFERRTRWIS